MGHGSSMEQEQRQQQQLSKGFIGACLHHRDAVDVVSSPGDIYSILQDAGSCRL
jgi:hypothetical protein